MVARHHGLSAQARLIGAYSENRDTGLPLSHLAQRP